MAGVAVTEGSGVTVAADEYGSAAAPSSGQKVQWVGLAPGTAGGLAPVSRTNPVHVADCLDKISVTLTLDTSAYANNDLIAEAQEVAGVSLAAGGQVTLVDLLVIDEDDVGQAFTVFLTNVADTWGSENSAPTPTDTVVRSIQAMIAVATYVDVGGAKIAHVQNINAVCETAASTSLYVAVVNGTGTPTYTASGVKLVFGFKRS